MSLALEAADMLERSAELLETDGWCQSFLWMGGRHCAIGSMLTVSGVNVDSPYDARMDWKRAPSSKLALAKLESKIDGEKSPLPPFTHWDSIVNWNNASGRTAEEVIDAMKLAAKDLRNEAVL
jgi:hypothetical protein